MNRNQRYTLETVVNIHGQEMYTNMHSTNEVVGNRSEDKSPNRNMNYSSRTDRYSHELSYT